MAIVLLIILYSLCFIILFDRITRKSQTRLSRKEIAFGFSFKVLMGLLFGIVYKKFYGGDDTWRYFNDSLNEYNKLLFQTGQFFKELIPLDSFQKYPDFGSGFRDFLENLEYNGITKLLAVFNVFSFQNYYLDVVFYNIFSFAGSYLLFKLFVETWREKRFLIYLASFFIPSVSFWLSGIRTDGLLLLSIAVSVYYFHSWMVKEKVAYLLLFFLGLIGTLVFRIQFFMLLLPFLLAWWLSYQFKWKPAIVFSFVFVLSLLLFFGSSFISTQFNLLSVVAQKQHEFLALKGNTEFSLNRLEPTISSFVFTLPQAFVNIFLRPYPWEAKGLLQWAASAEIIFFWIIFLLAVRELKALAPFALTWFVLCFAISTYLLIGYTVPYPGAVVRYKIIPELFFFILFVPNLPIKLKKITI